MALYKRGEAWYIGYYFNGKRVRKAIGPLKKEAQDALGKIKAEIREGRHFEKKHLPQTSIDDLIAKYLEWAKPKKSFASSHAIYIRPVQDYFKGKILSEISEYDVESFRTYRMDIPTRFGRKRSASTLNHELTMVKQLFNKAIAWGLAEKNPAAKVKKLPEPRGRTRFLSVEEAGRLLDIASRHLRPILICALETGMRRGEILNLKWSDVDMKNGILFVGQTKNGEPRNVPMSNRLRATLATLPRRLGADYVFTGEPTIGKTGKPFFAVRTSFENACRKAGITGFRFHDLRHTAASHMAMAGVPLKTIGEILGHRTTTMTERYSHLTPEHKKQAVEMLPDWEASAAIGQNIAKE